jgi:hypothetical protein
MRARPKLLIFNMQLQLLSFASLMLYYDGFGMEANVPLQVSSRMICLAAASPRINSLKEA